MKISVEKLHTTELGKERIKRNIGLEFDEVLAWCRKADLDDSKDFVLRKGKNWYVRSDDFVLTINAKSFTVITAHKTH